MSMPALLSSIPTSPAQSIRAERRLRAKVGVATSVVTTVAIAVWLAACGGGAGARNGTADSGTAAQAPTSAAPAAAATGSPTSVSSSAGQASGSASQAMPPALDAVGTHGEDLYDAVKARNWTKARVITDSLDAAVKALANSGPTGGANQTQLSAELDTLHHVVPAHQEASAVKAANRVTFLAAQMSAQYHPTTPAEVALLDYYGRELVIWSGEKNSANLSRTAAEIQQTWNALRPMVESHGGAAVATRTDDLIRRIAAAKSPAEYSQVANPLLDDVDALEKVFAK